MKVTRGSIIVGYLDNGSWSACFGLSYRDAILFDAMTERRIVRAGGRELRAVASSGNIPDSRNDVVRWFLDTTDGEWLFMVDTDMGFPKDAIHALVKSADPVERPFVGALCFAARRGPVATLYRDAFMIVPTTYRKRTDGDGVGYQPFVYPVDSLVPVDGTGAAAVLMHRTILEQVRETYGDHWYGRLDTEDGSGYYSEDLSLCIRLQKLGVPLYVNTAVKTSHHKGLIYLDEEMYLMNEGLTREGVKAGELPRSLREPRGTEDVPSDHGDD